MEEDIDELKTGCKIPDEYRPAITFESIQARPVYTEAVSARRTKRAPSAPAITADSALTWFEPLDPAPASDHLAHFDGWKMLGNNRYNDCVAVTWANMRRLVTSKLRGRETYPTMDQVMELYKTQNEDLEPRKQMVSEDLFDYLIKYGGPDGVKAVAYASVRWKFPEEVKQALAVFGALWIELLLNEQNKEEFDYKLPWKIPEPGNKGSGGHAVLVGGYSADGSLKIVTWGQTAELSPEFVSERVCAAWVVVWPEHEGSRRFSRGIDMQRLREEYFKLAGKPLQDLGKTLNSILVTHEPVKGESYLQVRKVVPNKSSGQEAELERYKLPPTRSVTPIAMRTAPGAILQLDNDDLYMIRTAATSSTRVEVHRIFGPQYYEFESETPIVTAFKISRSGNGVYCVDNGDLYFIKLPSPPDFIEVHWAPHEQRFQSVQKYKTSLTVPEGLIRAIVSGGDLYLLAKNLEKGCVRVICARGNANYSKASTTNNDTKLHLDDISDFVTVGLNGDIYMIKERDDTGVKVKVWITTAESFYMDVSKYVTSFDIEASPSVVPKPNRRWII